MLLVFGAAADQRTLAACALAAAILTFVPLLLLRPLYRLLLSAAVKTRPLEPVDLARLAHEPGAREALAELLASGDESSADFARAVLEETGASRRPPAPEPEELTRLGDPSLGSSELCAVAARLGRHGGELSGRTLWGLLPGADSASTAAAARAALQIQKRGAWKGPPSAQLARRRAAEAGALALLARAHREAGTDRFKAAVIEDFARVRLDALLSLHGLNGGPAALDDIRLDLWSPDPASRSAALELAEERLPSRAVAALAAWNDGSTDAAPRLRTRAAIDALDPALGRLLDGGVHAARTARFKSLPLFHGLETPYLLQLLEAAEERTHAPGDLLLREGDRGDALMVIEEGEVSVRSGGRAIAALGPGECLGELSVIDGLPRSADAVCASPARVLVIERKAFRAVTSGRPAVGLLLAQTLERRLRSSLPPVPAPEARPGPRALPDARESGARRRLMTAASLRRAPLLAGLPEPALAAVAGLARPVPVFKGETLFAEGDRGDALYLIASGSIRIETRGSVLAELGPGDVFGELALLSGLGRTAAARVAEDGLLFSIGAASFQRLLRDEPGVLWALLETLAGRLRSTISPASAPPR
jgi:CRP-like cAMP-binding protein